MKNIFVLYTGGTIGMVNGPHGLQPDTALVETALTAHPSSLKYHWHVCKPLIDSSAVTPQHWAEWLDIVQQALTDYDGILILHGTDTLAYTANLFALALPEPGKPLILTGAQKPYGSPGSDAGANLHTAATALLRDDIQETLIAFNGKLFPAVGSSKCSTETDNGFNNPHFGTWPSAVFRQPRYPADSLNRRFDPAVRTAALLLTPGESAHTAAATLTHHPLEAAALLAYGHGNAPNDTELIEAVRQFTAQNKILLLISQVAQGCAAPVYAQSSALHQAGALAGGKCNTETATVLLMLAAANRWAPAQLYSELQRLYLV